MKYFLHNTVGHSAMAWCKLLGYDRLGGWFHDVTLPSDVRKVTLSDCPLTNP